MYLAHSLALFRQRAAARDTEILELPNPFVDDAGPFAYLLRPRVKFLKAGVETTSDGKEFAFCAKNSTKEKSDDVAKDTVSTHEYLVNHCLHNNLLIVFVVKERIFSLVPRKILASHPYINVRENHPARMLNFTIADCGGQELNDAGVWTTTKSVERQALYLFPEPVGGSGFHA